MLHNLKDLKDFLFSPFYGRACRWAMYKCWEHLKPTGPRNQRVIIGLAAVRLRRVPSRIR